MLLTLSTNTSILDTKNAFVWLWWAVRRNNNNSNLYSSWHICGVDIKLCSLQLYSKTKTLIQSESSSTWAIVCVCAYSQHVGGWQWFHSIHSCTVIKRDSSTWLCGGLHWYLRIVHAMIIKSKLMLQRGKTSWNQKTRHLNLETIGYRRIEQRLTEGKRKRSFSCLVISLSIPDLTSDCTSE